jgi:hypothetical protein
LKLDLLRSQVKAGLDALARGDFVGVGDADLDAAFDATSSRKTRVDGSSLENK